MSCLRHPATGRRPAALLAAAAALLCGAALRAETAPPGQKPEATAAGQLFGARCTSCHTIGEGNKVGPDLLGVNDRRPPDWIRKFLTSPGKTIDSGDATATLLVKKFSGIRMPEQNLTPQEIDGLLAFFAGCTKQGGCQPLAGPRLGLDGTKFDIEAGRRLFSGAQPLEKGGPACMSCHHARDNGLLPGSTMGGDLTLSWARLHDKGWDEALMKTPLEKKVYEGRAPTDTEKFQLKAYFAWLAKDGSRERQEGDFFDLGLLGALSALGFIGIAWKLRSGGHAA